MMALDYDPVPLVTISHGGKRTLLQAAAGALGTLLRCKEVKPQLLYGSDSKTSQWIAGWKSIVINLVGRGADPNTINACPKARYAILRGAHSTPLLSLFTSYYYSYLNLLSESPWMDFDAVINTWATILCDAGVNLVDYGCREKLIWQNGNITKEWPITLRVRLIGFEYGPSPSDWKIWQNEPTDIFAGEFWRTMERGEVREELMPGTWID